MKAAIKPAGTSAGRLVDALGDTKARIANLEIEEKALVDRIIALDVDSVDGESYHAAVSRFNRTNVDWKSLLKEYHPPKLLELIDKYTSAKDVTSVRVYSR